MAVASETSGPQPPSEQAQEARREAGLTPLRRVLTLREGPIIIVTIVAIVYFGVSNSRFFNTTGLQNALLPFFAPYGLMAVGEVFVMINGEIDLSVGGTYLFAPFVFYEFSQAGLPLIPALILAMLVILAIGMINGFFVAVVG
ncbi:MAG: hypothetical protein ACRDK8_09785, partial [Solirubrobacteraceae bacterium]